MAKQYYIKMTAMLMRNKEINSTEKIFLSYLEVLTDKGTRGTDKPNLFFSINLGKSKTYIATMIRNLSGKISILFIC